MIDKVIKDRLSEAKLLKSQYRRKEIRNILIIILVLLLKNI